MESKPIAPCAPPSGRTPERDGRPAGPPRYTSQALFGAAVEVEIEHQGTVYRLRRTALDKLILTK